MLGGDTQHCGRNPDTCLHVSPEYNLNASATKLVRRHVTVPPVALARVLTCRLNYQTKNNND